MIKQPVFKWHRLRRWRDDLAFSCDNLMIGCQIGASLEVDLRALASHEFICLHDATLERETNSEGTVADISALEAKQLLMRNEMGTITAHAPMFFSELVDHMRQSVAGTLMQLDFKDDMNVLSNGHIDFFHNCLADCAEKFLLSCDNVNVLKRLARHLPQLKLGYDPCTKAAVSRLKDITDFVHFAENALLALPQAAYIYLEYPIILTGLDVGVDLVKIFHTAGMKVDAYTLNSNHLHVQTSLKRLVYAGVDQITTDEPEAMVDFMQNL